MKVGVGIGCLTAIALCIASAAPEPTSKTLILSCLIAVPIACGESPTECLFKAEDHSPSIVGIGGSSKRNEQCKDDDTIERWTSYIKCPQITDDRYPDDYTQYRYEEDKPFLKICYPEYAWELYTTETGERCCKSTTKYTTYLDMAAEDCAGMYGWKSILGTFLDTNYEEEECDDENDCTVNKCKMDEPDKPYCDYGVFEPDGTPCVNDEGNDGECKSGVCLKCNVITKSCNTYGSVCSRHNSCRWLYPVYCQNENPQSFVDSYGRTCTPIPFTLYQHWSNGIHYWTKVDYNCCI